MLLTLKRFKILKINLLSTYSKFHETNHQQFSFQYSNSIQILNSIKIYFLVTGLSQNICLVFPNM